MSLSRFTYDASAANFTQLGNFNKGLVMVRTSAPRTLLRDSRGGRHGVHMNELLEIVRQDRVFHEDIGRRDLVSLFNLLGNRHPLTAHLPSVTR